jgi:hypothetical protein
MAQKSIRYSQEESELYSLDVDAEPLVEQAFVELSFYDENSSFEDESNKKSVLGVRLL